VSSGFGLKLQGCNVTANDQPEALWDFTFLARVRGGGKHRGTGAKQALNSYLTHLQVQWKNACQSHRPSRYFLVYGRGHQPFWNYELLLVYRLMRRATSLIQSSEIKMLLHLPSIILELIFVNVKTMIMLTLFLEQARGRPTWSLRATWCPRAPRWWPLVYGHHQTGRLVTFR